MGVTPVIDRQYFNAIYFREPGACCSRSPPTRRVSRWTRTPEHLGEALKLPAKYEGCATGSRRFCRP
jgi:glyoxalase family protein